MKLYANLSQTERKIKSVRKKYIMQLLFFCSTGIIFIIQLFYFLLGPGVSSSIFKILSILIELVLMASLVFVSCRLAALVLVVFDELRKTQDFSKLNLSPKNSDIVIVRKMLASMNQEIKDKFSYQLLQKQAQMNAMQGQIQPHFLYNALDSIRGLALLENAKKTADMAEALAIFYRSSIGNPENLITLEEELRSVDNYIKIQRYRFGNRFNMEKLFDDNVNNILMEYKLPKLTLQPLVENSIYHGLNKVAKGGLIKINIFTTQSKLIISIQDNGQGIDFEKLREINEKLMESNDYNDIVAVTSNDHQNSGIGILNVNERIRFRFGNDYGMTVFSNKGIGTEIRLTLPLLGNEYDRNS